MAIERTLTALLLGFGAATVADFTEDALVKNDVINTHFSSTIFEGTTFEHTFGIEEPAFLIAVFAYYFLARR